jgi:hypothetical protein
MSYCRFAWDGSDVYVFESARGLECCGCRLQQDFVTDEPEDMIVHLAQHRRAGHFVPIHAIEGLWCDIPGAQRPPEGEPPSLTHARLIGSLVRLEMAVKEAKRRSDEAENQPESVGAVARTTE